MRAMIINGYGGPDELRLSDLPTPRPDPGELLVEVKAAGVNPADGKWRSGMFANFAPIDFPHILGYDIAGKVVEGAGFEQGSPVLAMLDPFSKGGYAEFAVVKVDQLAAMPSGLDFVTAAAIPTAGLTGTQLVEEAVAARSGQRLLITGAVGAVGRFAIHAALKQGAEVVAAVRRSQTAEALRLGATSVIVLAEESWSGQPFDHVIDTVGGSAVAALCRYLAPGGRIVTAATTPIDPEGLSATPEFFSVRPSGEMLGRVAAAVAAGEIEVPVARTLPLDQAAEAQRLSEAGGLGGKIVLTL